jgi:hypothetical protein
LRLRSSQIPPALTSKSPRGSTTCVDRRPASKSTATSGTPLPSRQHPSGLGFTTFNTSLLIRPLVRDIRHADPY